MLSTNNVKATRLEPWMEAIGPFIELEERDGILLAEIANCIVVIPLELKEVLTPYLGLRIAILRTDIPGKDYLFRVIPEREKTAPMTAQSLCRDEQIPIQSEVM